jgi:glycerophosphoryl diester phosphodiesterase
MNNIYLELTRKFNDGRVRAILAGGQAVVLHRLAIMSKDGDWVLREDPQTMEYVLSVLGRYGARYRFGAPLDVRWMAGGWSAHLEFQWQELRVRTDFVTRPPRLNQEALQRIWHHVEDRETPFLDAANLADMKKTNREKDYAVIGELARRMADPDDQILYSRSARDLIELAQRYPERVQHLAERRAVLTTIGQGREALEAALDAERRQLVRANEERLAKYLEAAKPWAAAWPALSRQMDGLPLSEAHHLMVEQAETLLPFTVPGGWP